jgi:hypothetical protein
MEDSKLSKVLLAVVFFMMFGIAGVYATPQPDPNNVNTNFNTNDNSSKATVGNVSGGNATGGSVTDNSKTTNTNTALSNSSANNNGNGNGNNNGNLRNVGNSSSNSSVKNSGNSNVRTSTSSVQGQAQLQGQGQQSSNTNSTGNDNKVYANAWPSVTPAEGTSSGTASSIFGSLGIADTEKYKKIQVILQTLSAEVQAGLITQSQAQSLATDLNVKLLGTVKTQRVLGILWETSGKNLGNVLGLLTFDSFWKDGSKQGGVLNTSAQTQATVAAADSTTVEAVRGTNNRGNVNH